MSNLNRLGRWLSASSETWRHDAMFSKVKLERCRKALYDIVDWLHRSILSDFNFDKCWNAVSVIVGWLQCTDVILGTKTEVMIFKRECGARVSHLTDTESVNGIDGTVLDIVEVNRDKHRHMWLAYPGGILDYVLFAPLSIVERDKFHPYYFVIANSSMPVDEEAFREVSTFLLYVRLRDCPYIGKNAFYRTEAIGNDPNLNSD
eukprot:gb/GECG01007620.1/.p1 GENE.gb/GECG01007620.1/~~gb/GECG01007620.1/.p1  ORF type:complete len:204 (+),score=11.72 gb/GECG01007620.1/:1-612(+)